MDRWSYSLAANLVPPKSALFGHDVGQPRRMRFKLFARPSEQGSTSLQLASANVVAIP